MTSPSPSAPPAAPLLAGAALVLLALPAAQAAEQALRVTHYNPGAAAIFPVSSTLVTGEREAILIDAQFGKSQAAKVVDMIRASGKKLSTIYISHGDPDFISA